MKKRIELIAAPTAIQPSAYVKSAYGDAKANTPWVDFNINRQGDSWEIFLMWPCAEPIYDTKKDVNLFADAVALLAPLTEQAPMMTMGDANNPIEGYMWRSDNKKTIKIDSGGLGSVKRSAVSADIKTFAHWDKNIWGVKINIPHWSALVNHKKIGIAVWQGSSADRAGLKSVTPNWITLT